MSFVSYLLETLERLFCVLGAGDPYPSSSSQIMMSFDKLGGTLRGVLFGVSGYICGVLYGFFEDVSSCDVADIAMQARYSLSWRRSGIAEIGSAGE